MVTHAVFLGHIVSKRGIATHNDKFKVILELELPPNSKGVQVSMGHMNYYRQFMNDYTSIAKVMFSLIDKFEWWKEAAIAFEKLKKLLAFAPILRSPDWNVIFHVHMNASGFATGSIMTQPREHKMDYPIYFSTRQLKKVEQNYTTTEREGLAMIYNCQKL